jgi:hypothetical protein
MPGDQLRLVDAFAEFRDVEVHRDASKEKRTTEAQRAQR